MDRGWGLMFLFVLLISCLYTSHNHHTYTDIHISHPRILIHLDTSTGLSRRETIEQQQDGVPSAKAYDGESRLSEHRRSSWRGKYAYLMMWWQ
jgi:hypothetical protein